jgi:predicted regulator of Ras-like GTPase activity (Roadblock/LC7/MglB family)
MTIPFLHFFKRAVSKLARSVERGPAPSPAPAPLAKPSGERLSKTVMPNKTRSSHRVSDSALTFNSARSRGVTLVPEPAIERVISIELGEIAAQIPAGYLKPIESGQAPRVLSLHAGEIEKGMATGQPTVSIASIYRQAPEMFLRNVADSDVIRVALPFEKVLEQFKNLQIRSDQVREPIVPQVETPFLSVTLQDKERFGTPIEPIGASPLPPVRVEPATAETLAAAQPEAKTQRMYYGPTAPVKGAISLHAPVPATAPPQPREGVIDVTPKPAMPPTRIPFLPNGADVPATERVPASSGASVPIRVPSPSAPARIPFNPPISFAQSKLPAPPPPEPIVINEEPPAPAPVPALKIDIKKDDELKISLPLRIVLQNLPAFQLNGDPDDVPDDVEIEFPFSLIEPQLSLGRVSVTPAQFEEAMPEGYREKFDPNEANTPVALPLQEVLKNLPAASLRMREDQEQLEIPQAIETPFSLKAAEDAKRLNIDEAPAVEIAPEKKDVEVTPQTTAEEALDAKTLVARASALPGIAACAVTFADGLSLAGNLPEDVRAEGLCAMAPSLLQRIGKHMPETKLGQLQAMTLHCSKSPITFLMEGNICLAALQKIEEIGGDTRAQLAHMLHELAKAFSNPEVAHVDH